MPEFALLVSARADTAFFARFAHIAVQEAESVPGITNVRWDQVGDMTFVRVTAENTQTRQLARLSCVHGVFEVKGEALLPLDVSAEFLLHSDFVWGEKYRGKTNETLTQFMINIGLQHLGDVNPAELRLLDPMCGRGTTLFWAMRYGMSSVGIEMDGAVLNETRRGLKKWTKLHRQKHILTDGWVQKANKKGVGKYLDFRAAGSTARIITGDSANAFDLTQRKPFDLIVTDVPYGVQHMGGKATRNPLETLQECAPGWAQCLKPGGVMVIAFNANIPKRTQLEAAFDGLGLDIVPTDFEHRMSESILRDILVMTKTG